MKTSRFGLLLCALCILVSFASACVQRAARTDAPVTTPAEAPGPEAATPEEALPPGLRFEVEPPTAEVFIDEKSYGAASELRHVPLPPGIYRVSIRAAGHTTWRAEVSVGERAEILKVVLPPRP